MSALIYFLRCRQVWVLGYLNFNNNQSVQAVAAIWHANSLSSLLSIEFSCVLKTSISLSNLEGAELFVWLNYLLLLRSCQARNCLNFQEKILVISEVEIIKYESVQIFKKIEENLEFCRGRLLDDSSSD